MRAVTEINFNQIAECFLQKVAPDYDYVRECLVKDPTAQILEITRVIWQGRVFDTTKIQLKYVPASSEAMQYQYVIQEKIYYKVCPPLELHTLLDYCVQTKQLAIIVAFANDCKDRAAESAAKSAAESAESAAESAESAAKYAEYAESAAKYAAESAEYAAKYAAKSAAEYAESAAKYAAKYAESAAESAEYAAESAEYAAESAAESAAEDAATNEYQYQCQKLRELCPALKEWV
jgi:hypothetical protein